MAVRRDDGISSPGGEHERPHIIPAHHLCLPPEQRAAALEIIDDYGLGEERGSYAHGPELLLGVEYTDDGMICGTSDDVAKQLIAAAPGCVFYCWEDPKYEWLGSYNAYSPELGPFSSECDANGNAVVNSTELRLVLNESATLDEAKERLDKLLGTVWTEMIQGYIKAQPAKEEATP